MAYNYGYKSEGTILDGILKWLQENNKFWFDENIKKISDLNPHFISIRKQQEPNKPFAKLTEKNAIYISKNLGFKVIKEYFKKLL